MRPFALLLALIACDEAEPDALLAVEQAPPPLDLNVSDLNPGQVATFTATGAFAGQRIWFARSMVGPGVGPCPPALGGLCFDVRAPAALGSAVANGAGVATYTVTLPPSVPTGTRVWFQAVQYQSGTPYSSDVVPKIIGQTCPDDGLEDNDTLATATTATPGYLPNRRSCDGDDDWYALSIAAGERLDIDAFFVHNEGNIDLRLTDANGNTLAGAASTTDDEALTYTATATATVYLQVKMTSDLGVALGNSYDLQIVKVGAPGTCVPDAFEPNDGAGTAAWVTDQLYPGLTACSRTLDDYYQISVPGGSMIDVQLFFPHVEGDIDLFLYDASGGFLGQSSGTTDTERVTWTAGTTTTVRIRVQLYTDTGSIPGNSYDMYIDLIP